jgi:uncharacterized membrane protein (DUF485 family)
MIYEQPDSHPARPQRGRHSSPVPVPRTWPPTDEPMRSRAPSRSALGHHRDLRVLRRAYRWQRRVAAFAALGYFTSFLVLSALAPHIMTRPATGGLSVGMLMGLVQLPVTWLAIALYGYTARRFVDPLARRVRRQSLPHGQKELPR